MNKQLEYNLDFWKAYDKSKVTMEPSTFSAFCLPYMKRGDVLLDVCCGNGRDSKYFIDNGLTVVSFDYETLDLKDKKPYFGDDLEIPFDHVYCRFVLHSIPEELEDYVLINAHKVLKNEGLLYIEVRSDKGDISDTIDNHYRRLLDIDVLRNKLTNLNFGIIFEIESKGLSVYNGEDPVLIRFVVQKKGEIRTRGTEREEKKTYNSVINPLYSIHLLLTVKRIFEENNIPFLLVFGTLLGAYRDKGFIKHDTDIDLALLDEYRSKVLELIDNGYFAIYGFLYTREWHKKEHLMALQYKTDWVDFWFFKKVGNVYKSGRFYSIKAKQIDNGLSTIEFYGYRFKTVKNIEAFLQRHYPNCNWRVPVVDYHAKF